MTAGQHCETMKNSIDSSDESTTMAVEVHNIDAVVLAAGVAFEDVELGGDEDETNEKEPSAASQAEEDSIVDEEDADEDEEVTKTGMRRACFIKAAIGLLLLGFIVYVIVDSATTGYIRDGIQSFLSWIQQNPAAGTFAFIAVYFLATIVFIPGSLLTLGAGFVFAMTFGFGAGIVLGTFVVFVGASLGASASFILARYLLQKQAKKLSQKYAIFEALDVALQENGLKVMMLVRLSPIIPYNVINYICGVSSVSFRDYALALFAILPGTILYVFLGASAGSLTESATSGGDPTITIIVVVVGVVFGVLAILLTTRFARKELNRILEERRSEAEETELSEMGNESGEANEEESWVILTENGPSS